MIYQYSPCHLSVFPFSKYVFKLLLKQFTPAWEARFAFPHINPAPSLGDSDISVLLLSYIYIPQDVYQYSAGDISAFLESFISIS